MCILYTYIHTHIHACTALTRFLNSAMQKDILLTHPHLCACGSRFGLHHELSIIFLAGDQVLGWFRGLGFRVVRFLKQRGVVVLWNFAR